MVISPYDLFGNDEYIDRFFAVGIIYYNNIKCQVFCLINIDILEILIYNDEMSEFLLTDYRGKTKKVNDKFGCILVPTTYELGKSEEYANLISEESSKRAIFKGW